MYTSIYIYLIVVRKITILSNAHRCGLPGVTQCIIHGWGVVDQGCATSMTCDINCHVTALI